MAQTSRGADRVETASDDAGATADGLRWRAAVSTAAGTTSSIITAGITT
ncbi:MAG: hypothetical protein QOJ32_2755, partial [Frankiaceae bacterium]|nr:hypothetical protein [Frankiaceae bacterium]